MLNSLNIILRAHRCSEPIRRLALKNWLLEENTYYVPVSMEKVQRHSWIGTSNWGFFKLPKRGTASFFSYNKNDDSGWYWVSPCTQYCSEWLHVLLASFWLLLICSKLTTVPQSGFTVRKMQRWDISDIMASYVILLITTLSPPCENQTQLKLFSMIEAQSDWP
jgi:hypothetical protein